MNDATDNMQPISTFFFHKKNMLSSSEILEIEIINHEGVATAQATSAYGAATAKICYKMWLHLATSLG